MSKLLDLFQGKHVATPPLWFMRQAGRYLPEYLEVRKRCKTFLDLCYTPELATSVTLQPLARFDLDAAIIFSDILVIPDGLGQRVSFEEDKGPRLSPLSLSSFQSELSLRGFLEKMLPVYETIRLTKSRLPPPKALIGFSGAPWTLALYMLEGAGSRDFSKAKNMAYRDEKKFSAFLDFLSQAISLHLIEQVKAGVQSLQLFDTWASHCPASHFQEWVIEPTKRVVAAIRKTFPALPIIGFPKGIGTQLLPYARETGVSALSLDMTVSLPWACATLPKTLVIQGNLDPLLLVAGGETLKRGITQIHQEMKQRPYIFNLGHGILPQTPLKNVENFVKWVRSLR